MVAESRIHFNARFQIGNKDGFNNVDDTAE